MTEIPQVAAELARAVELTLDPVIPQQRRHELYAACERFKETSPLCADCGLYLAQEASASHVVQHFGLQLLEHCIKYRWNQMTQAEKIHIKENILKLLGANVHPNIIQYSHVKDALSRVIVEMVKREWPQHWQTLLPELDSMCSTGPTQTEVVLLIFLRLVEDVAILQTLESNQRRKDIYQALTTNMAAIFKFFYELINKHWTAYNMLKSQGDAGEAAVHTRVVQAVLSTLSSFVDWVPITHIMANNGQLLQVLCLLLCNDSFRVAAADCLIQIVSRKGKIEDRKPLLVLFSDEAIQYLNQATVSLREAPNDDNNTFLKKFVQVMSGLGSQLVAVWGKEDSPPIQPANFRIFLDILLIFTQHPSISILHYANSVWVMFFKHEHISKDATFLSYAPKWIHIAGLRVVKPSFPITRHSGAPEAVAYALMDFESDEDYVIFYHRVRTEVLDSFRVVTPVRPLLAFQFITEWLETVLEKSKTNIATAFPANMPLFLQWEALSQVLDSVMGKILLGTERPDVNRGLKLLEDCVAYQPPDPVILSSLLSCISGLFLFLSMSPVDSRSSVLLLGVLNKIFSALTFSFPGEGRRSRIVKTLRRHAACLLVKISVKYPLILLPIFDQIYSSVQSFCLNTAMLSQMERATAQEALFLISNNFCDYDRQLKIIAEVVRPCIEQWVLLVQDTFQSVERLIQFVGLDEPPDKLTETTANNRAQISYCVTLFMSVVKRCCWPDDPDRAARGGFIVAHTESGNPIYRNPAAPVMIPILPGIFTFLKVFSRLYTPETVRMFSEGYKKAHSMMEIERNVLLGINQGIYLEHLDSIQEKVVPTLEKMQQFLGTCNDACYSVLGYAGTSLGREFYQIDYLAPRIVDSALVNLEHFPDFRLRPVIKTFLRQLVYSCPHAYYGTVLVPVFTQICPFMFMKLSTKWNQLTPVNEDEKNDTEGTQEVIDDMLTRALTREYLEVLKFALTGAPPEVFNSEAMDQDMEMKETSRANTAALQTAVISELGSLLLSNPACCHSIVLCILRAMSWQDTACSAKATGITGPLVRHLASKGILNEQLAVHIMTCVLQGLEVHGQHEGNNSSLLTLGVQMYELLRPKFPNVLEVLSLIPSFSAHDIQKLDEKILTTNQKNNKIEKCKKEIFRRLTSKLIGRSMGQLFRKEVHIADLPCIPAANLQKPEVEYVGLCQLFS